MSNRTLHVGARGGQYYIVKGKKVYVKKSPKRVRKSPRVLRGCVKQYSPKYKNRPSPAFPANECCGQIKKRDNVNWISEPDKNGVCKWKKF
ncbi:MAG TPA: hypothetical protein VLG50_05080 [Candidatus Saccharimonadales bacterium]|nr:hypothetical protein [Candidatus Saccharimonadales bacterium]